MAHGSTSGLVVQCSENTRCVTESPQTPLSVGCSDADSIMTNTTIFVIVKSAGKTTAAEKKNAAQNGPNPGTPDAGKNMVSQCSV